MATDGTELLKKSCAQANSYPANLVCKNVPSQVLVTQRERLWDDQNRLFHPITAYLRIRDVPVGEDSKCFTRRMKNNL